jgi:hypothetical protein
MASFPDFRQIFRDSKSEQEIIKVTRKAYLKLIGYFTIITFIITIRKYIK